jgi:hypothetical protein
MVPRTNTAIISLVQGDGPTINGDVLQEDYYYYFHLYCAYTCMRCPTGGRDTYGRGVRSYGLLPC